MRKQINLRIYGKVQGVFFRDSSRMKGRELNLFGWVRNEPDGSVTVVAEGEDENLNKFIEWCKNGFSHAKVDEVEVEWKDATGNFDGFKINK